MPLLPVIERLARELAARPAPADVEATLAALVVRVLGDAADVAREGMGTPLFDAPPLGSVARVRLLPGVYGGTPTSPARVRVLAAAAALGGASTEVHVHAPVVSTGTHRGRIAIDAPRRLGRALGLPAAEPGDRFTGGFTHALFDDEALVQEAAAAGLRFVARRGGWAVLERGEPSPEDAAAFGAEVLAVLGVVREAERRRSHDSPEAAVRAMRARGRSARRRGPVGRARLRRAIGWVDALYKRTPNCFRRTLIELALDAGAAGETLVFGLDVGRTGHVALKDSEEATFDVAFEIPDE